MFGDNEERNKEIPRPLILFVDEVLTVTPDLTETFQQPRRNVRLEMSKHQAVKLRDHLDALIQKDMPGSIGLQFKGRLII